MHFIISIPLFLYLLITANFVMFAGAPGEPMMNIIALEFMMLSGANIVITISDVLILISVVFLYIETFKATRTSNLAIVDHALSLVVFVFFLIEFLMLERLGNSTFLILTIASLMDVVMGFTVTISAARRDIAFGS